MTPEELDAVERELGTWLPEEYRSSIGDPSLTAAASFLWHDPARLLRENAWLRSAGAPGSRWPAHWIAIGDDEAASVLFIDATRTSSPVFVADHGVPECVECLAESVRRYALRCLHEELLDGRKPERVSRELIEQARGWMPPTAEQRAALVPTGAPVVPAAAWEGELRIARLTSLALMAVLILASTGLAWILTAGASWHFALLAVAVIIASGLGILDARTRAAEARRGRVPSRAGDAVAGEVD